MIHYSYIQVAYALTHLLPCYLVYLVLTLFLQVMEEAVVVADRVDSIGHGVDVPIVDLYTVVQNLGTSALLGYDSGRATLHSLKGRDTERLAHRGHDINVRVFQTLVNLLSAHETREVEAVSDATLGSKINHLVHHVATACHTETHIARAVKHKVGSLNKILWTFLHGDATEEGHHLVLASVVGTRYVL